MQLRPPAFLPIVASISLLWGLATVVVAAEPAADVDAEPFSDAQISFFESDVRPLLLERCGKCHGAEKQQGGLRLDSRAAVLAGGDLGPAATPGDPAASRLIEVVRYGGDIQMPPSGKLADREIAVLERWVREGLAWPPAAEVADPAPANEQAKTVRPIPWSFVPVVDPPIPAVRQMDWRQSPLDAFVLAQLEQAGLRPAPRADKRTLIRRLKFDLLGLPPAPEEVAAFLADESPEAYARLIDRYLAAPEYGQRWGRHWLDVARYADSNGQDENLAYINAYRYRDYVVDAFNNDKPYDQFVREQIAGDLLPPSDSPRSSPDQERFERLIATGFLTLGPKMLAEDDPVKMQMDIVDEQLDTLGGAFLGLTLGCARCHDHKFDPISTADYYALAGVFKSTQTMDNFKVVAQWHERPLATAAEVAALAAHDEQLKSRKAELAQLLDKANAELSAAAKSRLPDYLLAASDLLDAPPLASVLADPSTTTSLPTGALLREAESFDRGNVLVDATAYGAGIGVILNRGELPNFVEYDLEIPQGGWYQVELRYAAAEARSVQLLLNGKILKGDAAAQVTGSWNPDTQRWQAEGVYELSAGKVILRIERSVGPFPHFDRLALIPRPADPASPVKIPRTPDELAREQNLVLPYLAQWINYLKASRDDAESIWQLWFALRQSGAAGPSDVVTKLSGKAASASAELLRGEPFVELAELARRYQAAFRTAEAALPTPPETEALVSGVFRALLASPQNPWRTSPGTEAYFAEATRTAIERLETHIAELNRTAPPAPPLAMAVAESAASDLPIHIRGSHLTLGAIVPRGVPSQLAAHAPAMPLDASGRLQLAQWMTEPSHPLTSRVLVNRLWRWHFGAGLVRSTDNFGNLGDRPSHPELLDWLAARLIESGWSIKHLHRLILLSSTYQMSTAYDARAAEQDPDNRLLWRMNRRRLEAEGVRDALLFVAGNLDTSLGGTLLTNKPREYVANTTSINATSYASNRRSLYLPVIRSALYDPFQAFDFAEPTVLKGDRDTTTIASQALFMMNSDIMTQQTARLAARLLADHPADPAARVTSLYDKALGRLPADRERARAEAFVDRYAAAATDAAPAMREQQAWEALCRVILSSNEFLYVD